MKKNIKNILYIICSVLLLQTAGCNDFEELNSNPTKSESVNPNSQLAQVQLWNYGDALLWDTGVEYCSSFVQQMMGGWSVTQYGGQYRKYIDRFDSFWSRVYGNCIKELVDIMENTKDEPIHQNVRATARIFRVYYSALLTDLYGDIPYFDAGKGYFEGIVTPPYDSQEAIYKDFLNELKLAEAELNENGGTITGDVIYNGDIHQLKRFSNALRLRLAMRLVKVEPQLAQNEVAEILNSSSGLFQSSADDAIIKYNNINDWDYSEFRRNGLAQVRRGREAYPVPYICATFWNHLKSTNDPRLFRIGRAYYDKVSPNDPFNRIDLTEEILAQPNGIDLFQPSLPGFFIWDNWPNGYWSDRLNDYIATQCRPQLNNAFLRNDIPGILISYAEVQLLLSEAKTRWPELATEEAENHYKNGVTASIRQLNDNYAINKVSDAEINSYLSANAFPATTTDRLKRINEQLWILHLNNHFEAYANWRRSGYPVLVPSSKHGAVTIDSQEIPRRFNYPLFEGVYNKEAYDTALAKMGRVDNWNARVWWDKE